MAYCTQCADRGHACPAQDGITLCVFCEDGVPCPKSLRTAAPLSSNAGGGGSGATTGAISGAAKEKKEKAMPETKTCACGCGKEVSPESWARGWRYVRGHKPKHGEAAPPVDLPPIELKPITSPAPAPAANGRRMSENISLEAYRVIARRVHDNNEIAELVQRARAAERPVVLVKCKDSSDVKNLARRVQGYIRHHKLSSSFSGHAHIHEKVVAIVRRGEG